MKFLEKNKRVVYVDYNATAPLRPEAKTAMIEVLGNPGNPSSVHSMGRQAKNVIERSRSQISEFIGAGQENVVFTSGGTEADILALKGSNCSSILISSIEHDAVLEAVPEASRIMVSENGLLDIEHLKALLKKAPKPILISVMWANNETGVIQPIEAVSNLASDFDALVHVDAVQALGKLPIHFLNSGIDMLSISAHKIGGPTGIGALIIREDLNLEPIMVGGGQERGKRSGTENLAGIAGFGAAAEACSKQEDADKKIVHLRNYFEKVILTKVPSAKIIAQKQKRLDNTSAIFMPGLNAETQVMAFDLEGIAVSAGAACSSGKVKQSHVLKAMNLPDELINNTIRISFGWQNSEEDVNRLIEVWLKIYQDSN